MLIECFIVFKEEMTYLFNKLFAFYSSDWCFIIHYDIFGQGFSQSDFPVKNKPNIKFVLRWKDQVFHMWLKNVREVLHCLKL